MVNPQHHAELAGMETAIKLAAYAGRRQMHLGVNNLAAIWAMLKSKACICHRSGLASLKRIQHMIKWLGLTVAFS